MIIVPVFFRESATDLEIEWLVGPIPVVDDLTGKEIVNVFNFDGINNDGLFYTDSNGRKLIHKQRISNRIG